MTVPVGLTTSVDGALAAVLSVAGGAAGSGFRARTTRRDLVSRSAGAAIRIGGGGLTTTAGSRSGDADCCALAAEIPRKRTGTRKLEAGTRVRRRRAAMMMGDMITGLGMTSVARHSEPSPTIVLAHHQ